MQTLDSTIINVALPYIQGNLGATIDQATWVATGFIVANVIVIPLTPWLSRRLGRRRYFALSIVGFTVASVACGLAPSLGLLIIARVVQGAFGGGLLAVAQPILIDTFPHDQLGTSQGIFTIGAVFGPALGPALGGILTDNLDWRWVFFINVPFGILALTLVLLYLRDPQDAQYVPGDFFGIVFLAVGVGGVQYVLDEGERSDWFSDPGIVAAAIAGLAGYIGFVIWELFGTRTPIVKLSVFRNRSVAVGSAIAIVLGVPLFGATLILPQYVSGLLGFTATLSGTLILVRAVPIALVTPLAGHARVGRRRHRHRIHLASVRNHERSGFFDVRRSARRPGNRLWDALRSAPFQRPRSGKKSGGQLCGQRVHQPVLSARRFDRCRDARYAARPAPGVTSGHSLRLCEDQPRSGR
jgi:DHA2 family multidrug resistance protein